MNIVNAFFIVSDCHCELGTYSVSFGGYETSCNTKFWVGWDRYRRNNYVSVIRREGRIHDVIVTSKSLEVQDISNSGAKNAGLEAIASHSLHVLSQPP